MTTINLMCVYQGRIRKSSEFILNAFWRDQQKVMKEETQI